MIVHVLVTFFPSFLLQELFIQQLQDEIHNLRYQIRDDPKVNDMTWITTGSSVSQGQIIMQLQQKLKQAAKHIKQLSKEKEQLIEVGNRLRAFLNNNGRSLSYP